MGFFAEVSAWLDTLLADYVAATAATVATALEPALTALATVYVIGWGYLQLTGQIEEPLRDGIARIARLGVVFGVGLHLWLYNSVIVDSFFTAPGALAGAVIGAPDAVTTVDEIIFSGGDAASALMQKGGVLVGNFAYFIAGFFVYGAVGIAAVYTVFLLSLAKVALSVLLALGPLFIALVLFRSSRRFFDAWIAQLVNYALVAILATLVVALLMHLLTAAASAAAALGAEITIADAVKVCFAAALIFLVLRQVMPMAAGLANGMALSTHNAFSRSGQWLAGNVLSRP